MKSGQVFKPYIYLIRHNTSELRLDDAEFVAEILETVLTKGGVVLWEHSGIFNLIPFPILKNALQTRLTAEKVNRDYPRSIPGASVILWCQGIPISTEVVKNLLLNPRDQTDDHTDSDTGSGTTGENQTNQPEPDAG